MLSEMENAFFSELNLNELDETLKTYQEETGLSFSETVKKLILGELPWSQETMRKNWFQRFFKEIADQKKTALGIFLLLAGAAFLSGVAGIFEKKSGVSGELLPRLSHFWSPFWLRLFIR